VRLYLDFEADESYTPTHIQFLAGTGYNDLQQWADMRFDQPKGWIDVDFSGVGRDEPLSDSDEGDDDTENDDDTSSSLSSSSSSTLSSLSSSHRRRRRHRRRGRARKHIPVLRAYLMQIKILENHQNGKDTHLRGVQIFARDNSRREDDAADAAAAEEEAAVGPSGGPSGNAVAKKTMLVPEWASVPELR
jgi:anaphase-promoting complex subunit 10